jgi:hypothetical protein
VLKVFFFTSVKNTFNTVNYKEQFLIKLASTENVTFNVSSIKNIFCSVHTARMVTEWFQNQNINLLDWPSPDLNTIENMWGLMVKTMKKRYSGFQNKDDKAVSR